MMGGVLEALYDEIMDGKHYCKVAIIAVSRKAASKGVLQLTGE